VGKTAAVCFSVDDVHPATSADHYEAGGDLDTGALGNLARLLDRHPYLKLTLFVTPDWREISPFPIRRWLARLPVVRDHAYLAPVLPEGTMRLDRHARFTAYLGQLPRTELAMHGLHHVHRGRAITIEFQEQNRQQCLSMLQKSLAIFAAAGFKTPEGLQPPGWNLPPSLAQAAMEVGLSYVASARDVLSPIAVDATTDMSGLRGVPLIQPCRIVDGAVVHLPTNFQATSAIDRARAIVDQHGLLSIKGHIIKRIFDYVALDGIDQLYCNYLDLLFTELHRRYGERLWWATMAEVAAQAHRASVAWASASSRTSPAGGC
jgi:hypothetical protein